MEGHSFNAFLSLFSTRPNLNRGFVSSAVSPCLFMLREIKGMKGKYGLYYLFLGLEVYINFMQRLVPKVDPEQIVYYIILCIVYISCFSF